MNQHDKNNDYEAACKAESQRLKIAEGWAKINRSNRVKEFNNGRLDRLAGLPCRSAVGAYIDGWYSVPNPTKK
jgi:hypothetical protein